jgi:hypothetical protein
MSKPNKVFANLPKHPFEPVYDFGTNLNATTAAAAVEALKAQGFDAKFTRYKYGSFKKTLYGFNVWKREKISK